MAKSLELLARLSLVILAAVTIPSGFADTTIGRMLLPIEVLGSESRTVSRTVALLAEQAESVRSLWLQIHGMRYADQASVQFNASAWIPLNNNTVTIAEPGRTFGGIGGGFATLVMTLRLASGEVVAGSNTIRFRFNRTDGVVSAYRVLALNFLTFEGQKLLPPDAFVDIRPVVAAFAEWSQARRAFLKHRVKRKTEWSPALTNKVYSAQLWQLVKTWEMMQQYGLEGRGRDLFGLNADSRSWCNTIPAEAAPSVALIPDGLAGVGGSALTNEYFIAAWYQLQIILNSGNHQHRGRRPVDWVYFVGQFHDLFAQTKRPEPARLLVAVTKALQSTDPRLGPDDLREGWQPDQNIDPRLMISPFWAPIFKPLPIELHRAITTSLLAAWMDKNQQYPIAKYLPVVGAAARAYTPTRSYGNISGGKVWEAARQFRDSGVPDQLVARLQDWGTRYVDRAARIQYDGLSRH